MSPAGGGPSARYALAILTIALTLLGAGLLLAAGPAGAMIRDVSVQQLTASATTIVVGQVESALSYRDLAPDPSASYGGSIFTDVSLRVCSVLKGDAAGVLRFTIPGGTVGPETISSADAPHFEPGCTYMVFLDSHGQVVDWRAGQPAVAGARVPALGLTLRQAGACIRLQTGRKARQLAPLPAAAIKQRSASASALEQAQASAARTSNASARGSAAGARMRTVASAKARTTMRDTPVISSIDPPSAAAGIGAKVTIIGTGFGTSTGRVSFYFDEENGNVIPIDGHVVSWSDTLIRVVVPTAYIGKDKYPGAAGSGPVIVTTADGYASAGFPFNVTFAYGGKQWPLPTCTYRVNGGGNAAMEPMVDAAAQAWTAAGSLFQFRDGGTSTVTKLLTDGKNDIFWGPGLDSGIIASTWVDAVGSCILEVDLMFNSSIHWGDGTNGTMDVQTIALHEMGHWLNLRDLYGPGDAEKVMFGYGGEGDVRRELTPGDMAGIQWIYTDARIDRLRPTKTLTRPAIVRSGRKVDLRFRVVDPPYTCGAAKVLVRVLDKTGRVVVKSPRLTRVTNEWVTAELTATMKPGRYHWIVQARDLRGFPAERTGRGLLTVR